MKREQYVQLEMEIRKGYKPQSQMSFVMEAGPDRDIPPHPISKGYQRLPIQEWLDDAAPPFRESYRFRYVQPDSGSLAKWICGGWCKWQIKPLELRMLSCWPGPEDTPFMSSDCGILKPIS